MIILRRPLKIDLLKTGYVSIEEIIFLISILFPMAALDFLMTSPTTFLFPKGTRTRLPFSIFKLELYVKHCLRGTEMATS